MNGLPFRAAAAEHREAPSVGPAGGGAAVVVGHGGNHWIHVAAIALHGAQHAEQHRRAGAVVADAAVESVHRLERLSVQSDDQVAFAQPGGVGRKYVRSMSRLLATLLNGSTLP